MNNVKEFGAKGDGVTKDTAAIQRAIDAGGMVCFPPGIYVKNVVTYHLQRTKQIHIYVTKKQQVKQGK